MKNLFTKSRAAGLALVCFSLGLSAQPFAGGTGTLANPYQISTLAQLQAIHNLAYLGSNFILINDINAAATASSAPFTPIGLGLGGRGGTQPFQGSFNGQGYTIDSLFINLPNNPQVGLFSDCLRCSISNLGLSNINITGASRVGGLAGEMALSVTISQVYVSGKVSAVAPSLNGVASAGLLVGELSGAQVSNAYVLGRVTSAGNIVGGLAGSAIGSTFTNVYLAATVSGSGSLVDGVVGSTGTTFTHVFYNTDSASSGLSSVTGLSTTSMKQQSNFTANPSFLLKEGLTFTKVNLSNTLFIKSDKNYIEVQHSQGLTKVRGSIKEFMQQYNFTALVQVHRSYLINIKAVTGYDAFEVLLGEIRIPLGGSYKDDFTRVFKKYHGLP